MCRDTMGNLYTSVGIIFYTKFCMQAILGKTEIWRKNRLFYMTITKIYPFNSG